MISIFSSLSLCEFNLLQSHVPSSSSLPQISLCALCLLNHNHNKYSTSIFFSLSLFSLNSGFRNEIFIQIKFIARRNKAASAPDSKSMEWKRKFFSTTKTTRWCDCETRRRRRKKNKENFLKLFARMIFVVICVYWMRKWRKKKLLIKKRRSFTVIVTRRKFPFHKIFQLLYFASFLHVMMTIHFTQLHHEPWDLLLGLLIFHFEVGEYAKKETSLMPFSILIFLAAFSKNKKIYKNDERGGVEE